MKYLIVTGLSGAGKTACVRYLEDRGSFCMDNIPPMLLPKLLEAFDTGITRWNTVTIAVDIRSGEFFDAHAVAQMIRELSRGGHSMETIFMEASDDTLLARYKETRRLFPSVAIGVMALLIGYGWPKGNPLKAPLRLRLKKKNLHQKIN